MSSNTMHYASIDDEPIEVGQRWCCIDYWVGLCTYAYIVCHCCWQWRESVWNSRTWSGGFRNYKSLAGVECVRGCPAHRGVWDSPSPLPQKMNFLTWNGVFWCILSGIFFVRAFVKNVEFSAWSMVWSLLMDVEDVLWESVIRIRC